MDDNKKKLLKEIMELSFVALELNLFLDTHPENKEALEDYNSVSERYLKLVKAYEEKYGPLIHYGYSPSKKTWQWIEGPWPWEIEY